MIEQVKYVMGKFKCEINNRKRFFVNTDSFAIGQGLIFSAHIVKRIILITYFFAIIISCSNNPEYLRIVPENLKCEYLINPLGIDVLNPRFTWQMVQRNSGDIQQAFEIWVGTDSVEVAHGNGNVWESGKIKSGLMPVLYQGEKLCPFTKYYWGVKNLDKTGVWSLPSKVAKFETGMMTQVNWKGNWISDTHDCDLKPAPYFRKSFRIEKKVKTARAYIAVGGLYELSLNGDKVGDHRLDPMFTRYDCRTLYVTYDVTKNLHEGENVIGVLLGNGWYNHQPLAVWNFDKAPWRARPKFCMDLRITFEDESCQVVSTGADWKTALSPVVFNSIYAGEHYDARLEQPGWNKTGFNESSWGKVICTGAPSQNIVSQALCPIRNVEKIDAKEMIQLDQQSYLFDFGKNFSGVSKIKIKGERGTTIRLIHAEKLDDRGHGDLSNINVFYRPIDDSEPFQTDIFILKGKGEETFMPRFNYKGFRYVEIEADKPINLTKESLTAFFMHSDVPIVGIINSSNPLLNKIWHATNNSYLSNLFGYPTDCPQREKNGWTGDAHIAIETGLYNFDGITIYEKWLADHRDEQQSNGVLPRIVPTGGWGYDRGNGPDWTSSIAIIPWNIYLFYGDSHLLENCYDNIKRFVDYLDQHFPTGLTDWGLGDWVPVKSKTPIEFTSSIYFFVDAEILSEAAKILGKQSDYEKYTALASKIKNAINKKYLNRETGIYGSGNQTELSTALFWKLVPENLISKVAENLSDRIVEDNKHIDVGLLGSKTILNALSENGYPDLAYEVALQETFPSWGWWIINGATALPENWNLESSRDLSLNHIMFGEISAWFYKGLGGIYPDEKNPGFKNVILKPNFVPDLNYFEAKHEGPYGTIVSSWKRQERNILYKVVIPANSTSTLYIKTIDILEGSKDLSENDQIKIKSSKNGRLILNLESGEYVFSIKE